MQFLGANLIECLGTAAWISNSQPPGAHLSHKDNADLSARKPRESEVRHPVDVEHFEVLSGAEIPDLISGTRGLPRATGVTAPRCPPLPARRWAWAPALRRARE